MVGTVTAILDEARTFFGLSPTTVAYASPKSSGEFASVAKKLASVAAVAELHGSTRAPSVHQLVRGRWELAP